MKKLNKIRKKTTFFKSEIFCEYLPPTRHRRYKVIDFVPSNKAIMANKLPSINLERFTDGLNLRLSVNSAKYIAR